MKDLLISTNDAILSKTAKVLKHYADPTNQVTSEASIDAIAKLLLILDGRTLILEVFKVLAFGPSHQK